MYLEKTRLRIRKIKKGLRLLRKGYKKYKSRFLIITILGFLAGIFGSVGISAIIPLFQLIVGGGPEEFNFITKIITGFLETLHLPVTTPILLSLIVLLFAAKSLVQFFAKFINEKTTAQVEEDLRNDLFGKTLNANWPYLMEQRGGYLERVMIDDIHKTSAIFISVSTLILLATSFITYASVAFNISSSITIATIIFGGVIFFVFKPIFYKARKATEKSALTEKEVSHHISENLSGIKTVKSGAIEDEIAKKGALLFTKLKELKIKLAIYRNLTGSFVEPIGFLFIAILFMATKNSPGFSIASFAVVVYLIQKMFGFIQSTQGQLHSLNQLAPHISIVTNYRQSLIQNVEVEEGKQKFKFEKSLSLRDISFTYDERGRVLHDISLNINKGEMIGIVGASGAGKTTIADLLLRLFKPTAGDILIDGKNADMVSLNSWRKNIGYVAQDLVLINDTVENNIRFYDKSVSEADIVQAAELANIHETIEKFPEGMKTIIGERGVKISGGQRQRIVLARALVRKPSMLILDEATSALDNKSERKIQDAIEKLRGKLPIVVIAHRLSTILSTDRLIVLDKGKIIEEGNPENLLRNKDSNFYKMYNIRGQEN